MFERLIWTIEGVKFSKKNGKMIISPDDPQYQKFLFVSEYLDMIKFPYRIRIDKIDNNSLKYIFVVDDFSDIRVRTDDIYAVQDALRISLGLLNWSINCLQTH